MALDDFSPDSNAATFLERAILRLDESILYEAQLIRTTYSDLPADYVAILSANPFPFRSARNLLTNLDQAVEILERINLHLSHMRTVETLLNGWTQNKFDYNPSLDGQSLYRKALAIVSPNLEGTKARLNEIRGKLSSRLEAEQEGG